MEEKKKSGFATAGLVLGIIGICTSFIPIINNLSFILGLIGMIFGIVSLIKKASKGQAITGVILCILAMVITINSQQALSNSLNEVSSNLDKATGSSTEEVLANDVNVELGNFEVTNGSYGNKETKLTVKVTTITLSFFSTRCSISPIKSYTGLFLLLRTSIWGSIKPVGLIICSITSPCVFSNS